MSYEMQPVNLPYSKRGRSTQEDSEEIVARRKQLLDNPYQWFVWAESVKTASFINNITRRLMGLPSTAKMNRKNWAIKGAVRKNHDNTFRLYVGFFPSAKNEEGE